MKQDTGARDRVVVRDAAMIKRALGRRGLSYRETAFKIGVSPATVSRIANENGRVVSDKAAKKLCRLLDRDFEDFFTDEVFYVSQNYARHNRVA